MEGLPAVSEIKLTEEALTDRMESVNLEDLQASCLLTSVLGVCVFFLIEVDGNVLFFCFL